MLELFLAQAAQFLAAPAPPPAAPDAAYRSAVEELLAAGEFDFSRAERLAAATPGQIAVVQELLRAGGAREVRLAAVLAAGASAASPLAPDLTRAACELREPGAALAALLAAAPRSADLPALAYLALDTERPLEVRAAAVGRLLEAGCRGSWPVARSILRTGTTLDEDAPWCDWPRTGRYELPKRVLLRSLQEVLARSGAAAPSYEPNAAWRAQERQLQELEEALPGALAPAAEFELDQAFLRACAQLLLAAADGDGVALRAAGLLAPLNRPVLDQALRSSEPRLVETARLVIERTPG